MDIISILVVSACVLIPYGILMTIIAVISYKAKLRSAVKFFELYQATPRSDPEKSTLRLSLKIFIIVALALLGILICLIAIAVGSYLNIPLISDMDNSLLGKIMIAAFAIGTIITIAGSLLFNSLFKE